MARMVTVRTRRSRNRKPRLPRWAWLILGLLTGSALAIGWMLAGR